jgi:hypothetical protein
MSELILRVSKLSSSNFGQSIFLFNGSEHLRSQSKQWHVYELIRNDGKIVARISFHFEKEKALSPFRAPFGGVEIFEKIRLKELTEFLEAVEKDLRIKKISSIEIKCFPENYLKSSMLIEKAFDVLHWKKKIETTSLIEVSRLHFESKIKISERQKLRKAKEVFQFCLWRLDQLKEVYSFIKSCRDEKQQVLSLNYSQLKRIVDLFPHNFFLSVVKNERELAAAAITIKVSDRILYTFYYSHQQKFNKISPVVMLLDGIYSFARKNKIKMIDLGTSMLDGKINRSLLHFKKSVGGKTTRKLIFEKELQ